MAKTKGKNKKLSIRAFLVMVIFGLLFFNLKDIDAEVFDCSNYLKNSSTFGTSCDQLTGDEKDKCKIYNEKIKTACDLAEIKSKTGATLKNQLVLIDTQQQNNQVELSKTQNKVEDLSRQISNLDQKIKDKEELIAKQQTILTGLMQAYYDYSQGGILDIVLINQDFSEIFNQTDHLEQSGNRVSDVLRTILEAKTELQNEYDDIAQKKQENEQAKKDLENKKLNLQYSEEKKQALLTQTQGEEQKYQQLLAKIEQQKMELFDFSSASNVDEIINSVANYPKPPSNYWASNWYFSQRDSRWANQTIGNSKTLMSGYGCAVTALAMVFKSYGVNIDPGKMAKQPMFYSDLIKWPGSWSSGISLISSIAHTGVNWSTVNSEIAKGDRVIVYIRKTNGRGGHYVVIHNYDKTKKDYVVNDPYFGANLYLNTSRALVGKIGIDSGTTIDQMIIYKK